jgi:uncharacterized protein (TIGR03066 family)
MRTLLGMAAVLALACGVTAADEKIDGSKIVGKWEPKMPKKGENMKLEFTKDLKLIATNAANGKEEKAEGTYSLEGNKLTFKMTYMDTKLEATVTLTKLTDDEMVGMDKEGKIEAYTRVKPEKK